MAKKLIKYGKFLMSIALVFCLATPLMATSSGDAEAFVTKEEFDNALADFNRRLNVFESGINSKIDLQVTTYLDRNGIWSSKDQSIKVTLNAKYYDANKLIIDKIEKSGLMLLPLLEYYDFEAGLYFAGTTPGFDATNSTWRALGGPTVFDIVHTLNVEEEDPITGDKKTLILDDTLINIVAELDNGGTSAYRQIRITDNRKTLFLFVDKGQKVTIYNQVENTFNMPWWGVQQTITDLKKDYGTARTNFWSNSDGSRKFNWMDNSKWEFGFGIWGDVKIY